MKLKGNLWDKIRRWKKLKTQHTNVIVINLKNLEKLENLELFYP